MLPLVRAELTRLRWRRAVLVLLAAAFVIPVLILGMEIWDTRPVTAEERARAESQMAEDLADSVEYCTDAPEDYGVDPDQEPAAIEAECRAQNGMDTVDDWLFRSPLDVEEVRTNNGVAVITVVTLLAALAGTTFVGQDWASGSMSNQLLFEARRGRVWWAKAIALVLGVIPATVLILTLFWVCIGIVARGRGIETSDGVWSDVVWTQVRAVALVAGAAVLAYALTTLFRSTVAALGLMFGAVVLSSIVLGGILGDERWMLHSNAWAFVLGSYEYWSPNGVCDEYDNCQATITLANGASYLGALLVTGVGLSLWSFRRRDVP